MKHTEPFNGGLVTARDETALDSGALTQAEEAYYKPNVGAIFPVPGSALLGAAALANPIGLAYVERDADDDYIIVHDGSTIKYLVVGATTFATLSETNVDIDAGTTFDLTQLGTAILMVNGVNQIIYTTDPTTASKVVPAGLQPQTAPPTQSANMGAWTGATGNYWYWTTEYDEVNDIESSFDGTPLSVTRIYDAISDLSIVRPAIVNASATHWRLYRSASTGTTIPVPTYENPFPFGYMIDETTIADTVMTDNGSNQDFTTPYPSLTLTLGGVSTSLSRNGPPPVASTLEVFEGSICANDISNKRRMWFTYPEVPWAWPEPYYIDFDTPFPDEVICLRRVRRVLIALGREAAYRVNYLPRETDPEFDRGRVWDVISENNGLASPFAAATFTPDGMEPYLAFAGRAGIFMTDGLFVVPLEADLDWTEAIPRGALSTLVLRNIPSLHLLALFFRPSDESTNTKAYFFHYHSTHRAGEKLRVTGPITLSAQDAAYVYSSALNAPRLAMLAADGLIRYFDDGLAPRDMKLTTRLLLPAGSPEGEANIERLWVRHRRGIGAASLRLKSHKPGAALPTSFPLREFTPSFTGFSQVDLRGNTGPFSIHIESRAPVEYVTVSLSEVQQ